MRKYLAVFKITWQNVFEYRIEFFGHALANIMILLVMYFVWSAIFKEKVFFGGYTFSSMMTYLIVTKFLHFVNRQNIGRIIAEEIKNGSLSIYLTKPTNYLFWQVSRFLSMRIFDGLVNLIIFLILIFIFPRVIDLPTVLNFLTFVLFIGVSLIINFFINLLIAVSAFFITDIRLFRTTAGIIFDFLGGSLIPIDLIPPFLRGISQVLPFQFSLYFPAKIYQGSLAPRTITEGILLCFSWLIIFFVIARFFWQKGLKNYEAVGQ